MTAMDYRHYDNALGRFNSVDALAELMPGMNPYHFGFNNPVYWSDPTGLAPGDPDEPIELDEVQIVGKPKNSDRSYSAGLEMFELPKLTADMIPYTYGSGGGSVKQQEPKKAKGKTAGDYFVDFWRPWPVIGSTIESSEKIEDGDYWGSLESFGIGVLELVTFGMATEAKAGVTITKSVTTNAAKGGMTTVGRWMSKTEYEIMKKTGQMVEGAGGQTFVSKGGSGSFNAAVKGSVYAEFQVSTNSLLQGGQAGWFKAIGPSAGKAMQSALVKQGGQLLPTIQKLSPILKVK